MKVTLVSTTESRLPIGTMTAEELIVYIARVSNPGNQTNTDTSARLIAYLIKNKHWSPFEQADMTVEIVTSRAIAQQILRHRSFSFQEFSQRYAAVSEFEDVQLRYQANKNRQSSTDELKGDDRVLFAEKVGRHLAQSQALYREMLEAGVAKECARMVLPLTTQTTIYMKGSVRSWIHYLQIRCDEHTQLEHRQIALAIKAIFDQQFPNIAEALNA